MTILMMDKNRTKDRCQRIFFSNNYLQIVAESRQEKIPDQVNVLVGGLEAIGNSYTVSAQGCR